MRELVDQSKLDGEIDEGAGGLNDAFIVAQPHQRLDALDVLGPDIDLGLEGAAKALLQDGEPQRLLDLHSRQRLALHAGVEEGRGALAVVLDAIHRDIGVLTQQVVAAAVLGIKADPDRGRSEDFRSVDEVRSPQPFQRKLDVFRHLLLALDRIEQQQEFIAADPRQHVGFAQVHPKPLGDFDQQRIPDRMAVIVVDMLEIIDVEKCQREPAMRLVAMQEAVDAVLDHAPVRQAGQLVVIGRPEQVILQRLLLADIGGARQQQVAVRDSNRTVGGEKDLSGLVDVDAFLGYRVVAGAQQLHAGFAAMVQFLRSRRLRFAPGHPELRRGGVVHQQKTALLVLHRHAGREHSEDIPQNSQFGSESELAIAVRSRRSAGRVGSGFACRRLWRKLL